MYKSTIAPIVAVLALAVKGIFGIELPEDLLGQITDVLATLVLVGVSLFGIFKTHNKAKN